MFNARATRASGAVIETATRRTRRIGSTSAIAWAGAGVVARLLDHDGCGYWRDSPGSEARQTGSTLEDTIENR